MQIIVHHPSLYVSRGDKRGADVQLMLHLAYMGIDKELLARMINLKEPQRLELTLEEKAKWLHMHSKSNPSLFFARYKRPSCDLLCQHPAYGMSPARSDKLVQAARSSSVFSTSPMRSLMMQGAVELPFLIQSSSTTSTSRARPSPPLVG